MEYPKTIGMIDDEDNYLKVAELVFKNKGIDFRPLRPTKDFMHSKDFGQLDLLIFDIRLRQDFNGYDLAMRAMKTDPNTVKIMLSNEITSKTELECVQLKPLDFDNIIGAYNAFKNNLSLNHTCLQMRAIEYSKGKK